MEVTENAFNKYLDILNIRKKPPSMQYLKELIKAQLIRIPFEDISKIYYRKQLNIRGLPDFEIYLNGIEKYNFGGTCYPINYYFNRLLKHVGFAVKLCGADMSKPDVHMLNIVTLENKEYLVDAGFAAPFFAPIPRDLKDDFIFSRGEVMYKIKPVNEINRSVIELYEKDEFRMNYIANPLPRDIHEFEGVIEDSFSERSTFINSLFLARHYEDKTIAIYNLKLTEHSANITTNHEIKTREELIETVHREFEIPVDIIEPVIKAMSKLREELNKR
jgi:N-hydroxyarylamine O-acetyltransferase